MRARTKRFSVIGAALGLVLAGGVVVAPAAAPSASATVTCGYFNGLTVNSVWYANDQVALQAGESITATASPATSNDKLVMHVVAPGNVISFPRGYASTGLIFEAPSTATYALGWSWDDTISPVPANIQYKFTSKCSTTTVNPTPTPTPTPTVTTKPGKGGGKGAGKGKG